MYWIVTADWHYKSSDWLRRKELRSLCDILLSIRSGLKESPGLIILGDILDSLAPINLDDLTYILNFFSYWKDPVLIIPGNHDCYSRSTELKSVFNLFNILPNVYIGSDIPTKFPQFSIWEYYSNSSIGSGDTLLAHKDIKEINSFYDSDYAISLSSLESYKLCFNGHLHIMRVHENLVFTGPPYPITLGDWKAGTRGSLVLLDDATYKYRFIATNITEYFVDPDASELESRRCKFARVVTSDTSLRSDGKEIYVKYINSSISLDSNLKSISDIQYSSINDILSNAVKEGVLPKISARIIEVLYAKEAEKAKSSID